MKIPPDLSSWYQQWDELSRLCSDPESQSRLQRLGKDMAQWPQSQAASARAEIETAYFLAHAGFSFSFLEATNGRTADLECYSGSHRFFTEITVIQSTLGSSRRKNGKSSLGVVEADLDDSFFEQALIKRLLARMSEKGRQLAHYCAPVLLAVCIPDDVWSQEQRRDIPALDLQRLAALVVGVAAEVPQISAILLTFWKASARASRNDIRIRQVAWVTRPTSEELQPRIRLIAENPFAHYPLTPQEVSAIQKVL